MLKMSPAQEEDLTFPDLIEKCSTCQQKHLLKACMRPTLRLHEAQQAMKFAGTIKGQAKRMPNHCSVT